MHSTITVTSSGGHESKENAPNKISSYLDAHPEAARQAWDPPDEADSASPTALHLAAGADRDGSRFALLEVVPGRGSLRGRDRKPVSVALAEAEWDTRDAR